MANNQIQVINIPANTDVSLSLSGTNAKQIANAPGGVIEFISVDFSERVPLDRLRFDNSCYNLFVVNCPIQTNGSFEVREEHWLKNSKALIPNGLTPSALIKLTKYPAVIVRQNETHKSAIANSNALLCIIFDPEVSSDKTSIKFKYVVSKIFKAQILNQEAAKFGIAASNQSTELDHICWEVKEKNIINILGLEESVDE